MAQATWEKTSQSNEATPDRQVDWEKHSDADVNQLKRKGGRWKFLVGGALIVAAVVYLIVTGTLVNAQYFITVDEVVDNPEYVGETVRISGAVIGDSIEYDTESLTLDFTIANIPSEFENLAETLHNAVHNPSSTRLDVHMEDEVKPDLLTHEAQAIVTGQMGEDGVFYADELLLKCPSRFEDGGSKNNIEQDHPGMQALNAS